MTTGGGTTTPPPVLILLLGLVLTAHSLLSRADSSGVGSRSGSCCCCWCCLFVSASSSHCSFSPLVSFSSFCRGSSRHLCPRHRLLLRHLVGKLFFIPHQIPTFSPICSSCFPPAFGSSITIFSVLLPSAIITSSCSSLSALTPISSRISSSRSIAICFG